MRPLLENIPLLWSGLKVTLGLAAVALSASMCIGVALGTLASIRSRSARWLVAVYVETFRDIPLIVNVFAIFFGSPLLGTPLEPAAATALGLSLWGGANAAAIVRGGILSIPKSQSEAAFALSLRPWQAYLLVIWPQAAKAVLPAFTGLLALLIQSTSLGALVGVTDFLKAGGLVIENSTVMQGVSPAFTVYAVVLATYFAICSVLTVLSRGLERRWHAGGAPLSSSVART